MSPVMWDDDAGFVVFDATCCDLRMNDTGCDAPGCRGFCCDDCGSGCDIESGPGSRCARSLAAESDEDRAARVDRERAAFGLAPMSGAEDVSR
jgi:hypothetical protein